MIPKIIHYCWFGGKPLPQSVRKCIDSWRKYFPDYEIREWNESNVHVNMIPYTAGAYAAKKYAFVSDFVRFWVLHEHGGIYFDTDVEVIRPMDDIIAKGAFMGIEEKATPTQDWTCVAPGLGMACEQGHKIWKRIVQKYQQYDAFHDNITVCTIVSDMLKEIGIPVSPEGGEFESITLYPPDYFCPQAMMGAPIKLTERTRSIHHYDCTWMPFYVRWRLQLMGLLPDRVSSWIRKWKH